MRGARTPPPVVDDVALVVFDFDGVLVDSTAAHSRAWEELWQRVGVAGPPYLRLAGRRTADVVREQTAALSPSPETMAQWVAEKQARARELLAGGRAVFPDAAPAVRELAAAGFTLAIGSGASRRAIEAVLRELGVRERFVAVVAAEDVAAGKPDPEVYRRALELAGVPGRRALVVEDSDAGLRAAVGAGARAVSVRSGATIDDPRFVGRFADLRELARALVAGTAERPPSGGAS